MTVMISYWDCTSVGPDIITKSVSCTHCIRGE